MAAQTIKLKRSSVSGNVPSTSQLELGEVAINTYDGKLFIKKDDGTASVIQVGGGSSSSFVEKTTNATLSAGDKVIVDSSSSALTMTLPASPTLGDEIAFIDGTNTAATNNITIDRNGEKIDGEAADMTIDINGAAFTLVYYNSSRGWIFTER